jgi:cytochrome oxidase assembly protein ShyY1
VLVATSKYYEVKDILVLFIFLMVLCIGLAVLGTYLVQRSVTKIRHHDQIIARLKKEHSSLAEFVD